jgi:hypothetical protein
MWGTVLACFAAVDNFSGAVAIRFFLGLFEAAVTPGFALFTSQWVCFSSIDRVLDHANFFAVSLRHLNVGLASFEVCN